MLHVDDTLCHSCVAIGKLTMHFLNFLLLIDLALEQFIAHIHGRDCMYCRLLIGLNLILKLDHVSGMVFQDVSIFNDGIIHCSYSDIQSNNNIPK